MERAPLSVRNELLITARNAKGLSQERLAELIGADRGTVHRWEQGKNTPQSYYLEKLCTILGRTAVELGFFEEPRVPQTTPDIPPYPEDTTGEVYQAFRQSSLLLRLFRCLSVYPRTVVARYHELQTALIAELEDNTAMSSDDAMSRRDALRVLAAMPIEALGLSALTPAPTYSSDEVLLQCAAGITACWHLRKGKDLTFIADIVAKYVPTLQEIASLGTSSQRKDAAELLVQCLLLRSTLSFVLAGSQYAISYARQAAMYAQAADNPLLSIIALRTQAAAHSYAEDWKQALQAAQQAKYLLETTKGVSIPSLVHSYVYAGLATYQSYHGQKQDALFSLKKAHTTFFTQAESDVIPIWIDHNIGNLLLNDGQTHAHLGMYQQSVDSLQQIETGHAQDATVSMTCRIEATIDQVVAELSRDDQPRDMELCIALWKRGLRDARAVQAHRKINKAVQVYTAMRAAWPAEQRIKDLREHIVQ